MNSFIEGKYYVMTPPGERWSDFEGPFDSQEVAVDYIKVFVNESFSFSPEMLKMIVTHFKGGVLDMVKIDGKPLNGEYLYWQLGIKS